MIDPVGDQILTEPANKISIPSSQEFIEAAGVILNDREHPLTVLLASFGAGHWE